MLHVNDESDSSKESNDSARNLPEEVKNQIKKNRRNTMVHNEGYF